LIKGTSDANIPESILPFTDSFFLNDGYISVAPPGGARVFD